MHKSASDHTVGACAATLQTRRQFRAAKSGDVLMLMWPKHMPRSFVRRNESYHLDSLGQSRRSGKESPPISHLLSMEIVKPDVSPSTFAPSQPHTTRHASKQYREAVKQSAARQAVLTEARPIPKYLSQIQRSKPCVGAHGSGLILCWRVGQGKIVWPS